MNSYYEVTTPAASEPIGFNDAELWCRGISSADTELVNSLITTATEEIEAATNQVLISRNISGFFTRLCESDYEEYSYVELKRSPLDAVSSVLVNGEILDSSNYVVKKQYGYSRILFFEDLELEDNLAYPIEVQFSAGFGDAAAIPQQLKVAIQQHVLYLYENRGDISPDSKQTFPFVTKSIIRKNRLATGL